MSGTIPKKIANFAQNIFLNERMKLMAILIVTIVMVALAVMLLGVKVFFVKGGRFPRTHVHDSEPLRRRGIKCARDPEFHH